MRVTCENLESLAVKFYTNTNCADYQEFLEDLSIRNNVRKLTKKISKGNSKNLRLLTNHIIRFTNNFEIDFSKEVLLMSTTDKEAAVIRTVLLYLGYYKKDEYTVESLDLETVKMIKDMDK